MTTRNAINRKNIKFIHKIGYKNEHCIILTQEKQIVVVQEEMERSVFGTGFRQQDL